MADPHPMKESSHNAAQGSPFRRARESLGELAKTLPPVAVMITQTGLLSERFQITVSGNGTILCKDADPTTHEWRQRTVQLTTEQQREFHHLQAALWISGTEDSKDETKEMAQAIVMVDGNIAFYASNDGGFRNGPAHQLFHWIRMRCHQ